MHEEGHLSVRAAAEVPQPNVRRTAGGFATLPSGGSAVGSRLGRRLQRIGFLFHLGMPGWDWDQWRTWRRPRQRGEHRAYHASVESSLRPGYYTDVVVLYPELDDKKDIKSRKQIRRAAKLLCETHRSVRHEDGSVGKMVGAGDHLSYFGLVEVRWCSIPPPLPPPPTGGHAPPPPHPHPHPHPTQPFKNEQLLLRKRKRGGADDAASALELAAGGFGVFTGACQLYPAQQSPLPPARRCEKCAHLACQHTCFHSALGALAGGFSSHRAATLGEDSKQRHTSPPHHQPLMLAHTHAAHSCVPRRAWSGLRGGVARPSSLLSRVRRRLV